MAFNLYNEVARRTVFNFLSKYIAPELIMVGLYFLIWIDPELLGLKGFEGLGYGLMLEFVLGHAHTVSAVAAFNVSPHRPKGKIILVFVSLLYLLFVGAISYAMGSVLTTIMFISLSIKRIIMPANNINFLSEVFYAVLKIVILILSGLLGSFVAEFFPVDLSRMEGISGGSEFIPAWGVIYFSAIYFYERKFAKRFFNSEENGSISKNNILRKLFTKLNKKTTDAF